MVSACGWDLRKLIFMKEAHGAEAAGGRGRVGGMGESGQEDR